MLSKPLYELIFIVIFQEEQNDQGNNLTITQCNMTVKFKVPLWDTKKKSLSKS